MSDTAIPKFTMLPLGLVAAGEFGDRPADKAYEALVEERKLTRTTPVAKRPTRDALIALQYDKLKDLQVHVIERLKRALANDDDPLHAMAVEKLTERVVPKDFWTKLGTQEFAPEAEQKAGVSVNITITGSAGQPAEPAIEVEAREVP